MPDQASNESSALTSLNSLDHDFSYSDNCCDTFDIRLHPLWPKWLKQKDRLKGLSVVSAYKIDFKKLHAFSKPSLIVTGTKTIEPNKTVDKLLSREFSNARTGSLSGDHIAIYQNPETFVHTLKAFLRETSNGY